MPDTLEHFVTTPDGVRVCLVQISPATPPLRHVFMTHGAFSDRRVCARLANYLADHGCCCWVLEWRGHGASDPAPGPYDFEDVGRLDVAAALQYLVDVQNISAIDTVTHSGGGISLTIALLSQPRLQSRIRSVALFACQTSWAGFSGWPRLRMWLASVGCRLLGRFPARAMGLGPQDEAHTTMRQWYRWNLDRDFIGHDSTDFLEGMRTLQMPVIAIAAEGDQSIAPPHACQNYLAAFGSTHKRFVLAGPSYGHASVLSSRAAGSEIWPVVRAWLMDDAPTKENHQPS